LVGTANCRFRSHTNRLARLHWHVHHRDGSVADHLSTNAAIKLRTAKLERDSEVYKVMSRGMKVMHPTRGPGVVIAIEPDDVREKPLHVEHEDGQVRSPRAALHCTALHSAALHSAARWGGFQSERQVQFGRRVRLGMVQVHHYGIESAAKLRLLAVGMSVIDPEFGTGMVLDVVESEARAVLRHAAFYNANWRLFIRSQAADAHARAGTRALYGPVRRPP
jgi:hypothetical protein